MRIGAGLGLWALLVWCRLVTLLPMTQWIRILGFQVVDLGPERLSLQKMPEDCWYIPGYIEKLSFRMPWSGLCLPAAVASAIGLRRVGVSSLLVLGVELKNNAEPSGAGSEMDAHAWLIVGRDIVCGRLGLKNHRALIGLRCS